MFSNRIGCERTGWAGVGGWDGTMEKMINYYALCVYCCSREAERARLNIFHFGWH